MIRDCEVQRDFQRGAQLVEVALVLLLLLMLLGGVMDLGRAFNNYIIITNAAREGARIGSRLPCIAADPTQRSTLKANIISAVIAEATSSGVSLSSGNVVINPDPVSDGCGSWDAKTGEPLRVTVTTSFPTVMGAFVGASSLTLTLTLTNWTEMAIMGND